MLRRRQLFLDRWQTVRIILVVLSAQIDHTIAFYPASFSLLEFAILGVYRGAAPARLQAGRSQVINALQRCMFSVSLQVCVIEVSALRQICYVSVARAYHVFLEQAQLVLNDVVAAKLF